MSRIVKAEGKKFDIESEGVRSYNLKFMSITDKIFLKKKLLKELAQARSLIERVEGVLTREERYCKKLHNNNCSLMQKYIPASRKRKSTEENENLKNVDAATKVNHSDVSAAKAKGSSCLKKISKDLKTSNAVQRDSKNSIRPQKKARCSTQNDVIDAHDKNPQNRAQPKKTCTTGNKGFPHASFVDPHCKSKQMSSLEIVHAVKDEKSLAFRMPQQQQPQILLALSAADNFRMPQQKTKSVKEHNKWAEAKVIAAESTTQKTKFQRRMEIKKQRKESRLTFEKMKATVEFDDFNQAVKELKGFGCQSMSFYALRQLGLVLKDDDFDDHLIAQIAFPANDHDLEEGEIKI